MGNDDFMCHWIWKFNLEKICWLRCFQIMNSLFFIHLQFLDSFIAIWIYSQSNKIWGMDDFLPQVVQRGEGFVHLSEWKNSWNRWHEEDEQRGIHRRRVLSRRKTAETPDVRRRDVRAGRLVRHVDRLVLRPNYVRDKTDQFSRTLFHRSGRRRADRCERLRVRRSVTADGCFFYNSHSFACNRRHVQPTKPRESSGESEHVADLPLVPHEEEPSATTAEVRTGLQLPPQPENGEGTPHQGGGRLPHGVEQSRGTA